MNLAKFKPFGKIQLIDLNAAMGKGDNLELVKEICGKIKCRVGGGIRTIEKAKQILEFGAEKIIIGTSVFSGNEINFDFLVKLVGEIGKEKIIIAIDSLNKKILIEGWQKETEFETLSIIKQLEPYCSEFLFTYVDKEGTMQGIDLELVKKLRKSTTNELTVAGGIATFEEIKELNRIGVNCAVGMAIYTNKLDLSKLYKLQTEEEPIMKLSTAKGTRDFPPEEKIIRQEVVETFKKVFEIYGYNPIETPIIERYDTLAAKFASGEASDALKETFKLKDQGDRELGLRNDLTVPYCRFVGMNANMKMPFKRYQMGPVFRDGPIKLGRYRQFDQCDVDLVGSNNMVSDAEILLIVDSFFKAIDLPIFVELNNRKILEAILDYADVNEKQRFEAMIAIDKLKKIGEAGVKKELKERKIKDDQIKKILECFVKGKNNKDTLKKLKSILNSDKAKEGLKEVEEILDYVEAAGFKDVIFEPTLARGLAYYTGPVYEAYAKKSKITSSLAGGGRYDEMIGKYLGSNKEFPATGISFGVDVICEVMKLRRKTIQKSVAQVFIIPIGTTKESLKIAQQLREKEIKVDMDIVGKGISKNLNYANSMNIPFVAFIGEEELKQGKVKLKNMETGKEELLSISDVTKRL